MITVVLKLRSKARTMMRLMETKMHMGKWAIIGAVHRTKTNPKQPELTRTAERHEEEAETNEEVPETDDLEPIMPEQWCRKPTTAHLLEINRTMHVVKELEEGYGEAEARAHRSRRAVKTKAHRSLVHNMHKLG